MVIGRMSGSQVRERAYDTGILLALFVLWMTYGGWRDMWIIWVAYGLCAIAFVLIHGLLARERLMYGVIAVLGIAHAAAFQGMLLVILSVALIAIALSIRSGKYALWVREYAFFLLLWIILFDGFYALSIAAAHEWVIWIGVVAGMAFVMDFCVSERAIAGNVWRKAVVLMVCAESFLIVSFLPVSSAVLAFVCAVCSMFFIRHGVLRYAYENSKEIVQEAVLSVAIMGVTLCVAFFAAPR